MRCARRRAQQLYDIEHENVGAEVRAKASSVEQKDEAVTAVFSELVATCTASHGSKDVVDCFVASMKAEVSDARQPAYMKDPAAKPAFDAFGDAEDRVFPAHYTGLAWFSRPSGPALQFFSDQLPACAKRILLDVDGYYQTQGFGGEPDLIAVFDLHDRDPAEACFQESRLEPNYMSGEYLRPDPSGSSVSSLNVSIACQGHLPTRPLADSGDAGLFYLCAYL